MNWFEKQLHFREETENENLADAIDSLANAVLGKSLKEALSDKEIANSAIEEVLNYYHFKLKKTELPQRIQTVEDQIEYCIRPFGIKSRNITLDKGWYHHAVGAMIGTLKEDGSAVALIPGRHSGYNVICIKSGKRIKINAKNEDILDKDAICFYEPLPMKSLSMRDLLKFMWKQLNTANILTYLFMMAACTAMGMLTPMFIQWLFYDIIISGDIKVLVALGILTCSVSLSHILFKAFTSLVNSSIGIKVNIAVQAAVMNRMMSLPASFFREYSAGDLSQRSFYVQNLCTIIFSTIGITGLTSVFSLVYFYQIFAFSPSLVIPSLIITAASVVLSVATTIAQIKITREKMEVTAKTSGLTYSTISGIQKIKLAGAEKRMFTRWANLFAKEIKLTYNPPLFLKLSKTASLAITLAGTMILYIVALKNNISTWNYYAFTAAYGMVSAAFMNVVNITATIADIKPTFEMIRPILETMPENHEEKESITELNGEIELSHISFRYDDNMPNIIDDLSLKIKPGEYLVIVGSTGCGKSTLMRLLLGFESPQKGIITYDKKPLSGIDLESLRRKIGVVMQDGKLFLGDILSNILITAPHLGLEAAWQAAETAAIADDIRKMPMGMLTVISEGQGGISGGQKQRLMIARAIAPKPKILMFDEATSALDNVTQKKISEAIDHLKCTRIVIAHRLSTIQNADRILYLEKGKIVEEGTYPELIAKNGYFAKLVERQRLDLDE